MRIQIINRRSHFVIVAYLILILISTTCFAESLAAPQSYQMELQLEPDKHLLEGSVDMLFKKPVDGVYGFVLNSDFEVESVKFNRKEVSVDRIDQFEPSDYFNEYGKSGQWKSDHAALYRISGIDPENIFEANKITVQYQGKLYEPPDNRQFSREKIAFEVIGTIGNEGVYLSSSAFWYPRVPDHTAQHIVRTVVPKGWNCVTAGDPCYRDEGDKTRTSHVSKAYLDGIHLSAGKYQIKEIKHDNVRIMTYFFSEQADLADGYLESCRGYIDMYSELLGEYPFPKFAVVDNFLPSGYGMHGWTLLGSEVLRLPFIRFTSLGHEILHNWFGNSIFVDYRSGNWCEGLTVYLADYRYKVNRDSLSGVDYRRDQLRDFTAYVNEENDYPLTEFISRSDSHDRAIGYGKSMMVFHMLHQMMLMRQGTQNNEMDIFYQLLSELYKKYQFQAISYPHIAQELTNKMGNNLANWFEHWVEKPGAPLIEIGNVSVDFYDNLWHADFDVITKPANAGFEYPLNIRTSSDDGSYNDDLVFVKEQKQRVSLSGADEINSIELDPGFDVFRKLYPGEMPVTMAAFFGDPAGKIIFPDNSEKLESVGKGLKKHGQKVFSEQNYDLTDSESSLWLLNPSKELLQEIFGAEIPHIRLTYREDKLTGFTINDSEYSKGGESVTLINQHPLNSDKTIVCTFLLENTNPVAATRKLTHYGKYSFLVFDGAKNVDKGTYYAEGENRMVWKAE